MNETFTLGQVAKQVGAPVHTLRRFCERGMIRGVKRKGTRRVLNITQVAQARELAFLLKCGMSWSELRTYVELERAGDETIGLRKAMMGTKKRQLWQTLQEVQECIDFIERKEEIFDDITEGRRQLE